MSTADPGSELKRWKMPPHSDGSHSVAITSPLYAVMRTFANEQAVHTALTVSINALRAHHRRRLRSQADTPRWPSSVHRQATTHRRNSRGLRMTQHSDPLSVGSLKDPRLCKIQGSRNGFFKNLGF